MSENRQRNHVLTVRLNDDERARWMAFAQARGMSLAKLLRLSVESAMYRRRRSSMPAVEAAPPAPGYAELHFPTPYYADDLITLYHGDCREILPLLGEESFGAIITDPPYGVGAADWDRDIDWTWASHADRLLTDPGHLFCFWSVSGLRDFADIPGLKYERVIVWSKPMTRSSQRGNATWHWEPVFWFRKGAAVLTECVSDVMTVNPPLFRTHRENVSHPTQKPLGAVRPLVQWSGADCILDPFAGSGTTLRAAADMGKRAVGIERERDYCDLIVERLSQGALDFGETA